MTAQDIIAAIHGNYHTGGSRGLDNMHALIRAAGLRMAFPIIHVAGTNGKGSTCAMLESILRCAGYRTGLYTSPFLQVYQERIRINNVPLEDKWLIPCGERVLAAAEAVRRKGLQPTPFELGTLLAFAAFEEAKVDIAVVETGLGGRLDPSNVVKPVVSVITAIGLDHMAFLGGTLEAIAAEKAGIIKPDTPVCIHPAEDSVAAVFAAAAAVQHAPLTQLTADRISSVQTDAHGSTADFALKKRWERLHIALPGRHQLTNTLTALSALEELTARGWHIP